MTGQAPDLFDFPRKIQIQTLDRCNFACPVCPYPELEFDHGPKRLPASAMDRIVHELMEEAKSVRFCLMLQNEPFLDRRAMDFIELLSAADDVVQSISTVTNGSTLSEEQLDSLAGNPKVNLTISVNANSAEDYRRFHGVDRWERLTRLLTGWRGDRSRIRVSFVAERSTAAEAKRFRERWNALGYKTRLVPVLSRIGSVAIDDRERLLVDDFDYCHYPIDTLNILASGDAILCCNDWRHELKFGNILVQSIREIWHAPAYRRMRQAALDGELRGVSKMCAKCDYPMRSSVRTQLVDACGLTETVTAPDWTGTLPHEGRLTFVSDGAILPVLIHRIAADEAVIDGLCPIDAEVSSRFADGPVKTAFEIDIAHEGVFAFGTLSNFKCEAEARIREPTTGLGLDYAMLRLRLEPNDQVSKLLAWYEADWAVRPERVEPLASNLRKESV